MRKITTLFILLAGLGVAAAQGPGGPRKGDGPLREAQRKFRILVKNEEKADNIIRCNEQLTALQDSARSEATRGLFGDLLWKGYATTFTQKTVSNTPSLFALGVNFLGETIKGDREKWYRKAQQQCYYTQTLSSETTIDDFYALPSTKGAMDPENLKFEGFGCRNYIELTDEPGQGRGVFYVFCKMRRDEEGLQHIVNHSKFLVDIDTLIFYPEWCNLPNDSTGSADSRFSFDRRDGLSLTLKVRLYSSWMNEAMMIMNNQQLGEFTVRAQIDKNHLNDDGAFVYKRDDPDCQRLVSVEGDCFIVPRSYSGTIDATHYQPAWGTGQYRIEMEVSESCRIIDSYYQRRDAGDKHKWDKTKWQPEWRQMNPQRKGKTLLRNAWQCVTKTYKGSGWMSTLTDPLSTALYSYETTKLTEVIDDLHDALFSGDGTTASVAGAAAAATGTPTGGAGGAGNGSPAGNGKPAGNDGKP